LKNQSPAYQQSPICSALAESLLLEEIENFTEKLEGIDKVIETQIEKEEIN